MKKFLAAIVLCAALASAACAAYPEKPVRVIVPSAAGGAADRTVRLSSKVAEKYLGVPILVENRPDVRGTLAGATAAPDGYTLTQIGPGTVLNTFLKKVGYTVDSFVPVVQMVKEYDVIAAHKSQFANLASLKDFALANPASVRVGVSGALIFDYFEVLLLAKSMGVEFSLVPFNGSAPAVAAFLGDHVDLCNVSFGELEEQVRAGDAVYLCVLAEKRDANFPDVPTAKELGYDVVSGPWRGLAAPAGTPEDVLNAIADAYVKAFNDPEFKAAFEKAGMPADTWLGRAEFTDVYKGQAEVLKALVEEARPRKK